MGLNKFPFTEVIHMVSKLKYGNTNTFLIRGISSNLLVDTDYAGMLPLFYKEIKKHKSNIFISLMRYLAEISVWNMCQ